MWKKCLETYENVYPFPMITPICTIFYKSKKGGKDMYNVMIKNKIEIPTGKYKWNNVFNLTENDWKIIFKSPFIIIGGRKMGYL